MDKAKLRTWTPALAAMAYVAAVLTIDTLATFNKQWPIRWAMFSVSWHGLDLFKLGAWLGLPFLLSLYKMDWGCFGFRRWRKVDYYFLAALGIASLFAIIVAFETWPGLQNYYRLYGARSWGFKLDYVTHMFLWTASWLLGWEFMHRYFLLRPCDKVWPRFGWLIVPFSEGLYHLVQKSWVEAAGMVALSLVVTLWVVRRRNLMLPLMAHFVIELELWMYQILAKP